MRYPLVLLAASFILLTGTGCNNRPAKLIDEDTYINLMVELQLANAYQQNEQADSTTVDSLRKVIFKKYGTTKTAFEQSHKYYQQDVEAQKDRIDKAVERLRKDQTISRDSTATQDSTQNQKPNTPKH